MKQTEDIKIFSAYLKMLENHYFDTIVTHTFEEMRKNKTEQTKNAFEKSLEKYLKQDFLENVVFDDFKTAILEKFIKRIANKTEKILMENSTQK